MSRRSYVIGLISLSVALSVGAAFGAGTGSAAPLTKHQIKKITDDLRAYYHHAEANKELIDRAVGCVEAVLSGPPTGIDAQLNVCVEQLREPRPDRRPKTIAKLKRKYGAAAVKTYYACLAAGKGFFEETECLDALKDSKQKGA